MRVSAVSRVFFHRVGSAERVLGTLREQKYVGRNVPPEKKTGLSMETQASYQNFGFIRFSKRYRESSKIVSVAERVMRREGLNPEEDKNWNFTAEVEHAQRMNGIVDVEPERDFIDIEQTKKYNHLCQLLQSNERRIKSSKSLKANTPNFKENAVCFIMDVIDAEMLPEGTTLTSALEQYKTKYRGRIVNNGLPHDEKLKNYLLALIYFMKTSGFNPLNKEDVELLYERVCLFEHGVGLLEYTITKMKSDTSKLKQIAEKLVATTDIKSHYEAKKEFQKTKRTINYLNAYFEVLQKGLAA